MATPGYPDVSTHSTNGACGCGDTHAPAVASPVAAMVTAPPPPRFMQASMLQTPPDFKSPPLTGEFHGMDFSNWRQDWWKYIAGAIVYRILFD